MATVDLPFTVEYAKSARSACKKCKQKIDRDELRIAVMVQSRSHDGKDAHWHHFNCFFSTPKAKSVGDFAKFEELRFEDQQRIKTKISSCTSNGGGGAIPVKEFKVEYAKSAQSTCGICTKKIAKSEVRVSKKDHLSERALLYGALDKWHHLDCFATQREDMGFHESGAKLPGFQDLDVEDMDIVKRKLPILSKRKGQGGSNSSKPPKQAKLVADVVETKQRAQKETVSTPGRPGPKRSKLKSEEEVKSLNSGTVVQDSKSRLKTVSGASEKKSKKATNGVEKPHNANGSKDEEDEEMTLADLEMKNQLTKLYRNRDNLRSLKRADVDRLMNSNKQEIPNKISPDDLQMRLADNMTFGRLLPCEKCKGQFVYRSGIGYQCDGSISEFAKCLNTTNEPRRITFVVPEWAKEEFPEIFINFSIYPKNRLIPQHVAPSAASKTLEGLRIAVLGLPSESTLINDAKKTIELYGGKVSGKLHGSLNLILCVNDEIAKSTTRLKSAIDNKIPLVSGLKFIKDLEASKPLLEIVKASLISEWSSEEEVEARFRPLMTHKTEEKSVRGDLKLLKKETVATVKVKGGAIVDPDSGLDDVGHVLKVNGTYYNAVLNRVDVDGGQNSFYKIQVIESDNNKKYWVFRSWGRIGTTIGGTTTHGVDSKQDGIDMFQHHYLDKSGNQFGKPFTRMPGCYVPMAIDYEEGADVAKLAPSAECKLPMAIQELITLIFDVDRMRDTLLQFEIDLEKMPLGKISKEQIKNAYTVLSDILNLLKDKKVKPDDRKIVDATNRFFTYIPHNFGTARIPLLNEVECVQKKLEMLESLMEIEFAYELLKEGRSGTSNKGRSPIDTHYYSLKADIEVLEKHSQEYEIIQKYVANTHAETHNQYKLQLKDVFKVTREMEETRYRQYKGLKNKKLLWHGSRTTNFAGILSQGLRIAPPEAPSTGYMFGKGVYFADMVTKSANYCFAGDKDPGLLLLCEVALGEVHELTAAKTSIKKAPEGKHSVKGLGKTEPNPHDMYVFPDGVVVPLGKGLPSNVEKSELLYNEYIVYDIAQVQIRYLVRVEFDFAKPRR